MRYVMGLIGIIIGTMIIRKTFSLAGFFGQIGWAEIYLGSGGTYTLFKLIGVIVVVFSFLYMFDLMYILVLPFSGILGGFGGR